MSWKHQRIRSLTLIYLVNIDRLKQSTRWVTLLKKWIERLFVANDCDKEKNCWRSIDCCLVKNESHEMIAVIVYNKERVPCYLTRIPILS